jgi:gamma-glutamyltranspeptidase/glutathione hydrolase
MLTVAARAAPPPAAAIASAHPLATAAGREVLEAGGNAFDAAVAVAAALAVVEPFNSGLGGGGFFLLHQTDGDKDVVIDAREKAPQAATSTMYLDERNEVIPRRSLDGPLAAGIPGTPAALDHLAQCYGRLGLARDLAPAERLAREGFETGAAYQRLAIMRREALHDSPAATGIFLAQDEVPTPGFRLVQPDLADTLAGMAREGARFFYSGPFADKLVQSVRATGGIWQKKDLIAYQIIEREPLRGTYRGIEVISVPPPSSGGVVLIEMLNMLERFDLDKLDAITRKHVIVEVMRRAYRDRAVSLGDPAYTSTPVEQLISKSYAQSLAAGIDLRRATPSESLSSDQTQATGTYTTHFSVIDTQGNIVAATLSLNYPFGSGFMPPGTGVLLNDEMDDFSSKPSAPNAYGLVGGTANQIEPGKRPLSSMTPTILRTPGRVAALGTPGGSRIISMVLLGVLDFANGKPPKSWMRVPRFHHQYLPDVIEFEPGALTDIEQEGLKRLGHALKLLDRTYGNMQALLWDKKSNTVQAVSDPRGEGRAEIFITNEK